MERQYTIAIIKEDKKVVYVGEIKSVDIQTLRELESQVEKHAFDKEYNRQELLKEIRELKKEIATIKSEIKVLKGE